MQRKDMLLILLGRPEQVALTIQLNCTYPLAQPMEKSVDWGWSPGYHQVQDMYDRQATRRSM